MDEQEKAKLLERLRQIEGEIAQREAIVSPPPPQPRVLGPVQEFDEKTPETSKGKGVIAGFMDWATNQSMVPPASDEQGNLVYPATSQADVAVYKKDVLSPMAKMIAMGVAPELLPLKAGAGIGLVGRGAQYALDAGKVALAEYLASKGLQSANFEPKTTGEEDLNQALKTTAISGAIPLVADTIGTAYRVFRPNERAIRYAEAKMHGASGATLNAGRTPALSERELARQAANKEEVFLEVNPARGIQVKDPNQFDGWNREAFPQFQRQLQADIEAASKAKDIALKEADAAVALGKAVPLISLTDDEIKLAATQAGLTDDATNFALAKNQELLHQTEPFSAAKHTPEQGVIIGNDYVAKVPVKLTGQGSQRFIAEKIDPELEVLGAFDDRKLAQIALNPSEFAKSEAQRKGFFLLRGLLQSKQKDFVNLATGAGGEIEKANQAMHSLIEYRNLANRFAGDIVSAQAPGTAGSLNKAVSSTKDFIVNAIPGLAERQALVESQEALSMGAKAVQRIQDIAGVRSGAIEAPILAQNILRDSPRYFGMISSSLSLPRDSSKIMEDQDKRRSLGNLATGVGLLASPDQVEKLTPYQVKQVASALAVAIPQAFEASPDNVNTFDGKYLDPLEKGAMIEQHLDSDPTTRAMVVGGSFQNKYVPTQKESKPMPVQLKPQIDIGSINSQLGSVFELPATDYSYDKSSSSVLDELKQMKELHAQDF